jgi:hypothetical protein
MSVLAAALLLLAAPAGQEEIELAWGLPKDMAADYSVSDLSKGKPAPLKDRAFVVFGTELTADGGNALVVNTYRDLPWTLVLQLPKGRVKPGAKWDHEREVFDDARLALTPAHAFKGQLIRGFYLYRRVEKVNDVECARVDGVFEFCEIKHEPGTNRKTIGKPSGRLNTVAHFRLKDTLLVRGAFDYQQVRGQEFRGIKQGEEPKGVKLDLAEQIDLKKDLVKIDQVANVDAIHAAIRRGVEWLRRAQRKDGTWVDESGSFARDFPVGVTALCAMALMHSGVKPDDPAVRLAMAHVEKAQFRRTYEVAATLMAVETKYLPLEKFEDIQSLDEASAKAAIAKAITPEDRALVKRAAEWLLEKQTKDGTWGYPERSENFDHSNTQYAMLGLKSAARCGAAVPPSAWKKAAGHWLDTQRTVTPKRPLKAAFFSDEEAGIEPGTKAEEEFTQGPWGYMVEIPKEFDPPGVLDRGTGSMTCAGLTSLIIAESELFAMKELGAALKRKIEQAKKQGLVWLQEHYTVRGCPPSAGFWSVFHTYYLYSLERVGVLYGIRRFGEHDWYAEGALVLLREQREDGSWLSPDEIATVDTAFALLFLKKATMRVATRAAKKR